MSTAPGDTPPTLPDVRPIVAIAAPLLIQVPPDGIPLKVAVDPTHTFAGLITAGNGLTVIIFVLGQPYAPLVKVIVTVPTEVTAPPVSKPVTISIEAIVGSLLLQVPERASVSVIVPPAHT